MEPQVNPGLIDTLLEGSDVKAVVLDPLGSDIEPGPEFYALWLDGLGRTIENCQALAGG